MSKKLFAILLAVIFAFSAFAVGASAAGVAAGDEYMTVTITTDKGADTYDAEDVVTVSVNIKCNYNCTSFRFPILYDVSVLETKTNINLAAANTCATAGSISSNKSTDGTFLPDGYASTDWGCVLVQWVADVSGGAVGCINNPEGEVAFTFELKVKQGAQGKTGTILIPAETDLLYYQAIQDPTVATSFYYMSADTCTMTFNPVNVTVGASDVALVPNATFESKAVIDEDNLIVYGLDYGIASAVDVRQFVTATGGATVRVANTEQGYGTGSKINLTIDNATVKTYTMIIYGDLNGDCDISATDVSTSVAAFGGSLTIDDYVFTAADLNCDGDLSATDVSTIVATFGGSVTIDQTMTPFITL